VIKQIWKYPLRPDEFTLSIPAGAIFMSAQTQRGEAVAWFLVNPDAQKVERRFVTVGTGHEFDDTNAIPLATFQLEGGALVFHLFERIQSPCFNRGPS
jgi:hypothetical protein